MDRLNAFHSIVDRIKRADRNTRRWRRRRRGTCSHHIIIIYEWTMQSKQAALATPSWPAPFISCTLLTWFVLRQTLGDCHAARVLSFAISFRMRRVCCGCVCVWRCLCTALQTDRGERCNGKIMTVLGGYVYGCVLIVYIWSGMATTTVLRRLPLRDENSPTAPCRPAH